MSQRLVEVTRGSIEESNHYGDVAVVDSDGNLLWHVGDPNRVMFARSSAKPLQAIPLVESGAADFFQMTNEEIALVCSSHSGEAVHVETISKFLNRIGISSEKLACGLHAPYHLETHQSLLRSGQPITTLHNNCSGKHAGMLAYAKFINADLDHYLDPQHPVQQSILQVVAEMTGVPQTEIVLGTDGCGVPVYALPLKQYAYAYAQLIDPKQLPSPRREAVERIARAMREHPYLVAGENRFCTRLMEACEGDVLGKVGVEGVYCVGVESKKIGICVKIDDGNGRASDTVLVEVLKQLGAVPNTILDTLQEFHHKVLKNHAGTIVGEIHPVFTLDAL